MKFLVILVVVMGFAPLNTYADGNDLLEQCLLAERMLDGDDLDIEDFAKVGRCIGYISGVVGAIQVASMEGSSNVLEACFPEQGLGDRQAIRIVTSYLRNNPQLLHEGDLSLTVVAIKEAFPCE